MFVKLSSAGVASLEDADNFKAFKIVAEGHGATAAPGLSSIGRLDGEHVWVDPGWLKVNGRPDDAGWIAGLDKMLAYAKTAGWVDDHGAVRAHIETL